MRVYEAVLLAALFLPGTLQAQIYHIYRPVADAQPEQNTERVREPLFEIYGESIYSVGKIKDGNADVLTDKMTGVRGGVRAGIGAHVMLGFEGEQLSASDQRTEAISHFKRKSWQGTLTWTFTPNTKPKLYLVGAFGRVKQGAHLRLMPNKQFNGDTQFLSAGVGGEVKIWKGFGLTGEYRFVYDIKRWDNFVFTEPRLRHEFSAGLRYQF